MVCRFLTDLPKGLDSFNDICMEQQADSHVLEDNKKHVASIVQVRLLQSRPRPRAAAGLRWRRLCSLPVPGSGSWQTRCHLCQGMVVEPHLGGSRAGSRSPASGLSACSAARMGEACRGGRARALWLPCRRRSRAPARARR